MSKPPGDLDFVVRLSRPDDFLLEGLAFLPPQGGPDGNQTAGPFTELGTRTPTASSFAAFKEYYKGAPQLERIRIREFPSARNAWGAMMRGEIDFLYDVPPEAFDFVEQSSTTVVTSFLRPYVTALVFNQAHPVLGQRDVRLALNARHQPRRDHQAPACAAAARRRRITSGRRHWAYDTPLPRFDARSRARATRAARRARACAPIGARIGDRARFSFTCLVPADEPRFEQVALLVQRQLVEIGVDMRLEAVPLPVLAAAAPLRQVRRVPVRAASRGTASAGLTGSGTRREAPLYITHRLPRRRRARFDRLRDARTDADRRAARAACCSGRCVRIRRRCSSTGTRQPRAVNRRFDIPPRRPTATSSARVAQWRLAAPAPE